VTEKIGLLYAKFIKDEKVEEKVISTEELLEDLKYLVDITGWYDYVFVYKFRNLQEFLNKIIQLRESESEKDEFKFLQTSTACGIRHEGIKEEDKKIEERRFVATYVKLSPEEFEDLDTPIEGIRRETGSKNISIYDCIESYGWHDLILLMGYKSEDNLMMALKEIRSKVDGVLDTYSITGVLRYPDPGSRNLSY